MDQTLAMQLWNTKNTDAMILATMIMDSEKLSRQEIEDMIKPINYYILVDEFVYNVIVKTTFADILSEKWMDSPDEYIGRAGWNVMLTLRRQAGAFSETSGECTCRNQ